MASSQPQILIATPTNVQGANVVIAQPPSALTDKERRELSFFARLTTGLYAIGSVSIILGVGVLVAGIIAFALGLLGSPGSLGSRIEFGFTFVWAGFAFAIINGALVLKAAKMKPHLDRHWGRVLIGFGSTTLVMHLLDFIIAAISAATNDAQGSGRVPCSGMSCSGYTYYYTYYVVTATTSEAPRIVMLVILIAIDICQIVGAAKFLNFNANAAAPPMYVNQPMTVIQTNSAMPGASYVVLPSSQIAGGQTAVFLQSQPMMSGSVVMPMASGSVVMPMASGSMAPPYAAPPPTAANPPNKYVEAYDPPPYPAN